MVNVRICGGGAEAGRDGCGVGCGVYKDVSGI